MLRHSFFAFFWFVSVHQRFLHVREVVFLIAIGPFRRFGSKNVFMTKIVRVLPYQKIEKSKILFFVPEAKETFPLPPSVVAKLERASVLS